MNGNSLNTSITASVAIFQNPISKHKNKLMQVLDYNPVNKIEDIVKRIEQNEYYKARIYDKDISEASKQENTRYKLGKKILS